MMRRAAALLLAALATSPVPAGAQVSMGRLFSTPAERAAMETGRGTSAALAPNSPGQQPAPGTPGGPPAGAMPDNGPPGVPGAAGAAQGGAPAAASTLVMNGILRRGDNQTTVWLNNLPQRGSSTTTPNITVTLPSGRKVTLKAGQRYDLNEGRIKDVNEP
ncbi:hypothetical protein GJ699_02965 [Duganella sp. FT80W]|uniref:PEGA domain-containing protein n=1 Tax=Duganella guangzhouensis TaxID=2666084 RepID=A0A6I2KV01_9BURK|nr:hypothetical protein [Duganella guangzhouensis]MRW88937.1 hypothetical protein [Duganella guangzhouensis]